MGRLAGASEKVRKRVSEFVGENQHNQPRCLRLEDNKVLEPSGHWPGDNSSIAMRKMKQILDDLISYPQNQTIFEFHAIHFFPLD